MSEMLSRRNLLKSALVGGVAAATVPAMNLLPEAQARQRAMPKTWDEEVDVLVIGSGFAGLAAAAEAAKSGAKTIVLEKMPTYGGNSIINGGVYAAYDSELHLRQKLNYGNDSKDQHLQDTLRGGDFYSIPELAAVVASNSPAALNWMIDEGGAKMRPALSRAGGHTAYRTHTTVEGVGRGFTEPLRKIAEKNGAKLLLEQEVTWIWRADAAAPVAGVEVKTGRKLRNIKINKGLVLASGGFSRNLEMRKAHFPMLTEKFNSTNHKGATGEVIKFAQAVGADTLQMNFIQLYPYAEPETGILDTYAVYPFNGPGAGILYVTKHGKRFVNEQERRDVVSFAQLNLLKDGADMKPSFSIFNEEMVKKMGGDPDEVKAGVEKKRFIKAASLEELADKMGINKAALLETVKKHNQYLKDGKDPEFGKNISPHMVSLEKGPFYGIAQWPSVHHTMGGLRINPQAQVIDIWGKPIPKLYAAGEVTGGVHGSNRLGSNAIPDCVCFGRVAGTSAAKSV